MIITFALIPSCVEGQHDVKSMDLALTRAENVGLLRTLSVFDGRNVSSDLRRDAVKCDGLTACSPFSESTNESSKNLGPMFSHRPEPREQLRVGAGVLFDVSPNVNAAVQHFHVFAKRPFQCQALREAPVTHERLHHAVVRNKPEETFK